MRRKDIHELIKSTIGQNVKLIDHRKWVSMRCLLAEWTHARGTDNTPSAGISVNDESASIYNCYVCGSRPLSSLFKELEKYTGESFGGLIRDIEMNEFLGGELPEWGSSAEGSLIAPDTLDESYLNLFDTTGYQWYTRGRGVSDATADLLGLMYDNGDSAGIRRVVFPVYTPDSKLLGFTGRAMTRRGTPEPTIKVRDYYGLPKEKALLGSHLRTSSTDKVVVVEGLFDYARVAQAGYYAVAVMHAGLTPYQLMLLRDLGLPTVLMFDDDETGDKATKDVAPLLTSYVPVSTVDYRSLLGEVRCEKMDPGRLAEDEIVELVENADPV